MILDLSSLDKAVSSLHRALQVAADDRLEKMPEDEQEVIKAGVIQNLEFTYELCWKFMKRWIEQNVGPTIVDGVPRRQLFRISAEYKLISDVDRWMEYHRARNETSHIYDQDRAEEIFQVARMFYPDARALLQTLRQKQ